MLAWLILSGYWDWIWIIAFDTALQHCMAVGCWGRRGIATGVVG